MVTPIETDSVEPLARDTSLSATRLDEWPWVGTWTLLFSISAIVSCILVFAGHGAGPGRPEGYFAITLAASVCVLAAMFDGWKMRIPNTLTYTTLLLGLFLNLVMSLSVNHGWTTPAAWLTAPGMLQSFFGLVVCGACGLVGMAFAQVGGGDVKLLVALGALLGLTGIGMAIIASLVIAMIYALLNLFFLNRLNAALRIASHKMLEFAYWRQLSFAPDGKYGWKTRIPMAIPLALGVIVVAVFRIRGGVPS